LEALSKYIVRKGSRELATDPSEEYKDTYSLKARALALTPSTGG
jgi:hypothetical protein